MNAWTLKQLGHNRSWLHLSWIAFVHIAHSDTHSVSVKTETGEGIFLNPKLLSNFNWTPTLVLLCSGKYHDDSVAFYFPSFWFRHNGKTKAGKSIWILPGQLLFCFFLNPFLFNHTYFHSAKLILFFPYNQCCCYAKSVLNEGRAE